MPPYGRWRCFKIVAPASRAKEISGGIKNALDRGESLAKAKQSFINAGYTPQEVQEATQMIRQSSPGTVKPLNNLPQSSTQPTLVQPAPAQVKGTQQTTSKKTIIILAIVGVIILALALFFGLFWDKIF